MHWQESNVCYSVLFGEGSSQFDLFPQFQTERPTDEPAAQVYQRSVEQGDDDFEHYTVEQKCTEKCPLDLACGAHQSEDGQCVYELRRDGAQIVAQP